MAKRRSDVLARLGKRLRALREERGLSQEAVGERAGFSGKYVSEIERGRRDPPFTTLASIVEDGLGAALDATIESLAAKRAADAPDPEPPLPRNVRQLAREIVEVEPRQQRRVIELIRSALALARRDT
jgi:transcriptional regulator with XRE-family HTH domain